MSRRLRLYVTESGVLVRLVGRERGGKVLAYRHPSDGFHGFLWARKLRPAMASEVEG